jgi:hypothetical protein
VEGNPVTGDWDSDLVREVFWEEDAQIILAHTGA